MANVNNQGRSTALQSGVYTTYFGGVKKLLSEYFSTLVIPQGTRQYILLWLYVRTGAVRSLTQSAISWFTCLVSCY